MSAILQAANDVRTLARQAVSLQQIVTVLDKLGSLDLAEQEANQRVAKMKEQVAELEAEVQTLKEASMQANAQANEIAQGAQTEANRITAMAQREAEGIVSEAKTAARGIKEEAQAVADAANRTNIDLVMRNERLDGEIVAKQIELKRVTTVLDEVRARLR